MKTDAVELLCPRQNCPSSDSSSDSSSESSSSDVEISDYQQRQVCSSLKLLRKHWKKNIKRLSQNKDYINPSKWWSTDEFEQTISNLHPYVRAVLSTPGVSSLSESIFSLSGSLKSSRRANLNPEKLCQMICISININTLFSNMSDFVTVTEKHLTTQKRPRTESTRLSTQQQLTQPSILSTHQQGPAESLN